MINKILLPVVAWIGAVVAGVSAVFIIVFVIGFGFMAAAKLLQLIFN